MKEDKMKEDKDQRVFKMLEVGDLHFSDIISQGYMMMGLTRRGKTTLGHYLCNNSLKGIKEDSVKLIATTNADSHAKIGITHNSQTQIPNIFRISKQPKGQKGLIIDCPGWEDSYGCQRVITNSYFNFRVFSKIQKVKFIVVFQSGDLRGTAQKFILTVKMFLENFKLYSDIKKDILKSTVFVITKCNEKTQKVSDMKDMIKKLLFNFQSCLIPNNLLQNFKEFIMNMIEKDKIFIFKLAEPDKFMASQNTLLKQISDKTDFWKRDMNRKTVDMSEINFSVLKYIQAKRNSQEYINGLKRLMEIFNNRWKDVIQHGVSQIFKQIMSDTFAEADSCKFIKLIDIFQKDRYVFFLAEQEQKRVKAKLGILGEQQIQSNSVQDNRGQPNIFWLRKMNVSECIFRQIANLSDLSDGGVKRNIQTIVNISEIFMKLIQKIAKIIKNTQQNKKIMENYAYLVYRMFEEGKVLFQLFNNTDKNSKQQQSVAILNQYFDFHLQLKDAISSIFDVPFKENKRKFALNYKIPEGLTVSNYRQILQFFKSVEPGGDVQNKKILKEKQSALNLKICTSDNAAQVIGKFKRIKTLNELRQTLYLQLQQDENTYSRRSKILNLFKTMNSLGEQFCEIGSYQISIKCYDSVYNITKALQTYRIQIQRQKNYQQKIKYLIAMSQYASVNFRMQLAMQKLHETYSICKTYQQMDNVSKLLFKYGNHYLEGPDYQKMRQYLKNIMEMKMYKELSEDDTIFIKNISSNESIGVQRSFK